MSGNLTDVLEQIQQFQTMKPHGWCTVEKASVLHALIRDHRPRLVVEIGVYGGASLVPIAIALKGYHCGRVHGIDPWRVEAALENMTRPENRLWWAKINYDDILASCNSYIQIFNLNDVVTLMRLTSEKAVDGFQDDSIDMIHFDGNHSEECSMLDVTLYLPKVRTGGVIVFDDVHWAEASGPTQEKACQYLLDHGCVKIMECDKGSCWVLTKEKGCTTSTPN